jgi:protoporphyrinogen/coproporphyrinogen III oxidase
VPDPRVARTGVPTVAVVGGGIAGLAAAWELSGGADGPGPGTPAVVVVEATDRVGGKLRTVELDGRAVDVGPDGFLGRRPEAADLCREMGLGDQLVPIGTSGAAVWARGRRRPLPAGLVLGVPTRLLPVARSGILSPAGTLRLLRDVVAPRPDRRGPLGDRAIGPLVRRKLGRQVVERLVDPMLGGIYAGGVADASAAAVFPLLLAVAQRRASFMRALGRASGGSAAPGPASPGPASPGPASPGPASPPEPDRAGEPAPAFWALRGGLEALAARLAAALLGRGVEVRTGHAVSRLDRGDPRRGGWVLQTSAGRIVADAVVLAVPSGPAADLLAPHDADTAVLLRAVEYSSVAVVTLAYPDKAVLGELFGTGLLVPHGTPLPSAAAAATGAPAGETCVVTACTFLSAKWPHLARPGELLLRASVGRFGDDRFVQMGDDVLVSRVAAEVAALVGMDGEPASAEVTRWPSSFPQYRVHHLLRVAGVEAAATRLGGLAVAGAAYRGVGVPACISSGRQAALAVLQHLSGTSPGPGEDVGAVPEPAPSDAG